MSISGLSDQVFAWIKTQSAELLKTQTAQTQNFNVGAQYEGKVLDLLPSGRQLVQVGDQKLDMALPGGARPGDSVRLTYLGNDGRPTFLLEAAKPGNLVALSGVSQQIGALMKMSPAPPRSLSQLPLPEGGQTSAQAATASLSSASTASASAPAATNLPAQAAASAPSAVVQGSAQGSAQANTLAAQNSAQSGVQSGAGASKPTPGPTSTGASAPASAAGAAGNPTSASGAPLGVASTAGGLLTQATLASAMPAHAVRTIVANVLMLQHHTTATPGTPAAVASANTALVGQAVTAMNAAQATRTQIDPAVQAETAPPPNRQLPAQLEQTLRQSGLFYESHLAGWTRGKYPFDALLNEPQARLNPHAGGVAPGMADMPDEAARIAGRQLHMLDGAPLLWQGFAWPGQWMDWLVRERQDWQEGGQETQPADQWDSELRLVLPRMGTVVAQLSLRAQGVRLSLHAPSPQTVSTLRAGLPALAQGLEAAGLQVQSLKVDARVQADSATVSPQRDE